MNKESVQHLGRLIAMDEEKEASPLSSLWKAKLAVLVFVRHFG